MKRRRVERPWTPFERRPTPPDYPALANEEVFLNSRYQVYRRRFDDADGARLRSLVHLSIKRRDQREIRDWRDLQRIKNELAGDEWEAIEIFPAESRLVDSANQYHLWCFPFKLPFGFDQGRFVSEGNFLGAKQRPWEDDARPDDLATRERVTQLYQDFMDGKIADWLRRDP